MTGRMTLLFFATINILLFQNCGNSDSKFTNTSQASKVPTSEAGNGQPYDGKVYVLLGEVCPDGSQVRSKIVLNSTTSASLVRDNCQDITPVVLASNQFQLDASGGDKLIYLQQTYVPQAPSIQLSKVMSWTYQLAGALTQPAAQLYDVDMFGTTAQTIQSLKAAGRIVICYIPAGHYETDRPDSALFNPVDIGNPLYKGSPDRWLDTRSASVRSLIIARLDLGKSKGCDGIDFDSVDAYTSVSGFPLTATTQLDFNRYLAAAARSRGLIVALNNVPDLALDLVNDFDFVVAESCYADGDCAKYQPFTAAGKPVFDAEYTAFSATQCSSAKASSISLTYFSANLDGTRREICP